MPQRRPADRGSILTRLRRAGLSRFGHRAGVKAAANPPPAVQHVSQTAARPGCGGAAVVHASAIQNDTLGLTVGSGEVCTLNAAVSSSPFAAADTFKKWTICELYGQPVTGVADVKAAFARARAEQGGGCVRSIPATMVLRNGDAAASRRALGSLPAAPGRTTAVFAMRRPPSASWGLRVRDLPGGIGSVLVHVGAGTPSAGAGAEAMVGWRIARVTAAGRPPLLAPSRNDVLSCLEPCSDAVVEFEPIDREMLEAMPAEQLVRVLECLPRLDRGDMYGVLLRLCERTAGEELQRSKQASVSRLVDVGPEGREPSPCPVCFDDLWCGEVCALPCGRWLHRTCAAQCIQHAQAAARCPCCRACI